MAKLLTLILMIAVPGVAQVAAAETREIAAKSGTGVHVWEPEDTEAKVGDVIEWRLGSGTHGVRITNWAAVKNHIEVEQVAGQQPFDTATGRNSASTNSAGQLLLRVKAVSMPPAPGEIKFNCIVHGATMSGKIKVAAEQ